jgi:hypothetical protein
VSWGWGGVVQGGVGWEGTALPPAWPFYRAWRGGNMCVNIDRSIYIYMYV